jgi:hypothetical protein
MLTHPLRANADMGANSSTFQQRFVDLLWSAADDGTDLLRAQPGFAIYRNTVRKGLIDALQANYPAVNRLVGNEWFRAVGEEFVSQFPAIDARLMHYGAAFADFLETFPPASALPYLADVARLDRFWTLAHTNAAEADIDLSTLVALTESAFSTHSLRPRASAYWACSATQPIFSLWSANRDDSAPDADLSRVTWIGESIIVLRPFQAVTYHRIDAATIAFLNACHDGLSIAHAAAAALLVEPECDLKSLIATLIQIHAFSALTVVPVEHDGACPLPTSHAFIQ